MSNVRIDGETDDPLVMQNYDTPGMVMVKVLLTDLNFFTCNKSVKRALGVKNKLGFISGDIEEPTRIKWKRVDEMVTSRILNSMIKDIAETFIYCTSARLWVELE